MFLTLVEASSTRAMELDGDGSVRRRLLVFHKQWKKQSAKELKGAEHIEKPPTGTGREEERARERVRGKRRSVEHFHPIISSNFIKTRLDRPSAPNCNHNRRTSQCTRYPACRYPLPVALQPRCFFLATLWCFFCCCAQ